MRFDFRNLITSEGAIVPFEETWAAITSRRWPSPSAFNAAHNQEEDLSVAGAHCHSDAELADDDAIAGSAAAIAPAPTKR